MTYTDEEIEAAFRFMDLDKNGYLGANELRHCLICMGEMITDEEVDMMINMVDGDGDGQVSFTEFHTIIRDPDPGRPDFGKEGVSATHVNIQHTYRQKKKNILDFFFLCSHLFLFVFFVVYSFV